MDELKKKESRFSLYTEGFALFIISLMSVALVQFDHYPHFDLRLFLNIFLSLISIFYLARFGLRYNIPKRASEPISERIFWFCFLSCLLGIVLINYCFKWEQVNERAFLFISSLMAQALLSSVFLGPQLSLIGLSGLCWIFLIMNAVVPPHNLIISWVGGAAGSFIIRPFKDRGDLIKAILVLSLALAIMSAYFFTTVSFEISKIAEGTAWGVLGVALSMKKIQLISALFVDALLVNRHRDVAYWGKRQGSAFA